MEENGEDHRVAQGTAVPTGFKVKHGWTVLLYIEAEDPGSQMSGIIVTVIRKISFLLFLLSKMAVVLLLFVFPSSSCSSFFFTYICRTDD